MRSLEGLGILVTGATSGLGLAIAREAWLRGARLALCGRSEAKLEAALAGLRDLRPIGPGELHAECFDATETSLVPGFVARAVAAIGRIEVLVNCAGANSARGPVAALDEGAFDAMLRLNCHAPLAFVKALHPLFEAAGSGLVVNILTTCCLFANEGLGAYTASKTAFEGLVKVYRKEARTAGIRVCAVYPGGIDSPFRPQSRPEYLRPDDVAEAVLNLVASPVGLCPDELVLRPTVERNFG